MAGGSHEGKSWQTGEDGPGPEKATRSATF